MAKILTRLKCSTLGCERAAPQVPATVIHTDTVLPVYCGGCGAVLHCDHEPDDPVEVVGGTLSRPTLTATTRCGVCYAVLDEKTDDLAPVAVEDLPASALQALGVPFARA